MQKTDSLVVDDYEQAIELFYERGWTDGLPVVLPTRRLVDEMLARYGRDRHESLGAIPPKGGQATIEKLAINAVMGGCRPEHFPVRSEERRVGKECRSRWSPYH